MKRYTNGHGKRVNSEKALKQRKIVGQRLRVLRKYYDVSQRELADALRSNNPNMEFPQETISYFERGGSCGEYDQKVEALARFFQVPPEYFFPEVSEVIVDHITNNESKFLIALRSWDFPLALNALSKHFEEFSEKLKAEEDGS